MTGKQKRFIEEYLIDLNATQAAIRAGYSKEAAKQQGYKLLNNPDVRAEIDDEMLKLSEQAELNRERIFREILEVAFMSQNDAEGLLSRDEPAFTSVKVKKVLNDKGETIQREVKADRLKALELLLKYFGKSERERLAARRRLFIIDNVPKVKKPVQFKSRNTIIPS